MDRSLPPQNVNRTLDGGANWVITNAKKQGKVLGKVNRERRGDGGIGKKEGEVEEREGDKDEFEM